jgi:pimeloyl-ACP methyl ester carboxylesterase
VRRERSLSPGVGRVKTRDGLSLWYKISGRGPGLLVPTPGWGASVDMYMKSLTPLEKDFSVIYLDTRGAGRSDGPAKSSGFAFPLFLADLETLRVHLQLDRWFIFAHSDAGLQALGYAIKHTKVCRGLFIVDGATNLLSDKESNADDKARMKKLSHRPWFVAAMKAQRKIDNPNISDENFKYIFLGDLFPLYFASYEAAVKARHYFSASTYRVKHNKYDKYAPHFEIKQVTKIQVPTAVFEGDGDVITTPLEAIILERSLPNSTLFMIRNAGHFPWLEQRETFFKNFAQAAHEILKRQ